MASELKVILFTNTLLSRRMQTSSAAGLLLTPRFRVRVGFYDVLSVFMSLEDEILKKKWSIRTFFKHRSPLLANSNPSKGRG